jgi:hypothetical protein
MIIMINRCKREGEDMARYGKQFLNDYNVNTDNLDPVILIPGTT